MSHQIEIERYKHELESPGSHVRFRPFSSGSGLPNLREPHTYADCHARRRLQRRDLHRRQGLDRHRGRAQLRRRARSFLIGEHNA